MLLPQPAAQGGDFAARCELVRGTKIEGAGHRLGLEVDATSIRSSQLHLTDLETLNPEHLHDAHLLISTYRLRHALKNTR